MKTTSSSVIISIVIERFDIILLTVTVLRTHAQTRQLLSESGTQDTFSSPKPPRVPRLLILVNNLRVTKLAQTRVSNRV
jgi:hypothetical protein